MSDYDNNGKGALWLKTAKSGIKYMSGEFEWKGEKFKIAVFKNTKKQKETHPDYNVAVEVKGEAPQVKQTKEVFQDDVPDSGVPF